MTHLEIQKALKEFRRMGAEVNCKLNQKTYILKAEYDRLVAMYGASPWEINTLETETTEAKTIETETIASMASDVAEILRDVVFGKRAKARYLREQFNQQVAESEERWAELLRQR